jgi:hypothetical protein
LARPQREDARALLIALSHADLDAVEARSAAFLG